MTRSLLYIYENSRIIWSSATVLSNMLLSQISLTKLDMKLLVSEFTSLKQPLSQMIHEFLKPFYLKITSQNINVEVIECNEIPDWACTDWNLYSQILFHILANAFKFSSSNGQVQLYLSFHTFEGEFGKKSKDSVHQ